MRAGDRLLDRVGTSMEAPGELVHAPAGDVGLEDLPVTFGGSLGLS
jgi:hypothetical protein